MLLMINSCLQEFRQHTPGLRQHRKAGKGWGGVGGGVVGRTLQLTSEKASATALAAVLETLVKDCELELATEVTLPTRQQSLL